MQEKERGWRGTFCIVTDWVGKDSSKLTWDDVRELVRRGHEIATHTKTHRNLVELLKAGKGDEVRLVPNVVMGESCHTGIKDVMRAMASRLPSRLPRASPRASRRAPNSSIFP